MTVYCQQLSATIVRSEEEVSHVAMHEFAICANLLQVVEEELRKHEAKGLKRISLKIGRASTVDPDCLRFCFEISTAKTRFEGADLDIVEVPLVGRCRSCGWEAEVSDFLFVCPRCGSHDLNIVSGKELEIEYLEIE